MKTNAFKLLEKAEEMAEYCYVALKNYPKSERYSLATDTRKCLWQIIKLIIKIKTAKNKTDYLFKLDDEISLFRVLVRMGMRLGFLPFKKYEILSGYIAEIGKMTGGLIKYERNKRGQG